MSDDQLTAWALAARDGDRRALERFVAGTQDAVHRLAAHLVDPAAADDVQQETYLRMLRAIERYRGEAPARLWLLSIARRTAMDHLRGRYRRRRLDDAALATRPEATTELGSDVAARELLDVLDPDQRAAFVATQVLGLPYDEAAELCDCPVGTIRSRVHRARAAMTAAADEVTDTTGTGSGPAAT